MQRHFHEELKSLKERLFVMSFLVEDEIYNACDAFFTCDRQLAKKVIISDKKVDSLEIEIDEKGHSLLALRQPMAVDLRLITMILKINTDLERIGDHSVNIAEKTLYLAEQDYSEEDIDLQDMVKNVNEMLHNALDSFLREDHRLAKKVLKQDDNVDDHHNENYFKIKKLIETKPEKTGVGMNLLMISHNLERIADLASNIAEDVIYWKQGKEVRHRVAID